MKLSKNETPYRIYGEKLIDGSISDAELKTLIDLEHFPAGFKLSGVPVSDHNHTRTDAIYDFVSVVAPKISEEILHTLVKRLIVLEAENAQDNTFLRNPCLAKHFFAYELFAFPQAAEQHYESDTVKRAMGDATGVNNLKNVIMIPVVERFKNPEPMPCRAVEDFDDVPSSKFNNSLSADVPASIFLSFMAHPAFEVGSLVVVVVGLAAFFVGVCGLGGGVAALATMGVASSILTFVGASLTGLGLFGFFGSVEASSCSEQHDFDDIEISSPLLKQD